MAACLEQELAHSVAAQDLQASDPGDSTLKKKLKICDKCSIRCGLKTKYNKLINFY
jgi:hypothetical protein